MCWFPRHHDCTPKTPSPSLSPFCPLFTTTPSHASNLTRYCCGSHYAQGIMPPTAFWMCNSSMARPLPFFGLFCFGLGGGSCTNCVLCCNLSSNVVSISGHTHVHSKPLVMFFRGPFSMPNYPIESCIFLGGVLLFFNVHTSRECQKVALKGKNTMYLEVATCPTPCSLPN